MDASFSVWKAGVLTGVSGCVVEEGREGLSESGSVAGTVGEYEVGGGVGEVGSGEGAVEVVRSFAPDARYEIGEV